jgi:hypothetical protein
MNVEDNHKRYLSDNRWSRYDYFKMFPKNEKTFFFYVNAFNIILPTSIMQCTEMPDELFINEKKINNCEYHSSSVADPDPGLGTFLTPRSGIRDPGWEEVSIRIRDPG